MPSSPTTRNRLEKQGAGENSNTWGAPKLNTVIDLVDASLDGWTTKALTGNYSLTSTNYAADESRNRVLKFTGTGSFTVTIPSVEKWYLIDNQTTGTLTVTTGSGTTATLRAGVIGLVACDGTNCKRADNSVNPKFSGEGEIVNSSSIAVFDIYGDGQFAASRSFSYGTSVNPSFGAFRARGSIASPSAVQSGDNLGALVFYGRDTAGNWITAAGVTALVSGTVGSGSVPTDLIFSTGGNNRLTIDKNGVTSVLNLITNTTSSAANVYVDGSGQLQRSTSSARYKDNIRAYQPTGDFMALRPVYYTAKGGGRWYGGLIAEELHAAGFSEFVEYNDEGQPEAIHYAHMVALLTHHLQDALKRIEKLEAA